MQKTTITLLALIIFFLPLFVFAQNVITIPNPLSAETFEELIDIIINWLLVITLPVVVLIIVYAGFMYITGPFTGTLEKQKSPEGIRQAKKMIMYALIGYAIILLSKVLIGVITGLFS